MEAVITFCLAGILVLLWWIWTVVWDLHLPAFVPIVCASTLVGGHCQCQRWLAAAGLLVAPSVTRQGETLAERAKSLPGGKVFIAGLCDLCKFRWTM